MTNISTIQYLLLLLHIYCISTLQYLLHIYRVPRARAPRGRCKVGGWSPVAPPPRLPRPPAGRLRGQQGQAGNQIDRQSSGVDWFYDAGYSKVFVIDVSRGLLPLQTPPKVPGWTFHQPTGNCNNGNVMPVSCVTAKAGISVAVWLMF